MGGRIRQDYHASLRGGLTPAAVDATQTFNGLGLTAGLSTDHPVGESWGLYSVNRLSLLLGQNNRKSASNGAELAGPFSNSLSENKTAFFPAAEVEAGVRYLAPLGGRSPLADGTGPILSLRVGFVGQYYDGIAFLSATSGAARFDERPLFLAGFTLMAGIEY